MVQRASCYWGGETCTVQPDSTRALYSAWKQWGYLRKYSHLYKYTILFAQISVNGRENYLQKLMLAIYNNCAMPGTFDRSFDKWLIECEKLV